MHKSTRETFEYRGLSADEIQKLDQRIKQLPNALDPNKTEDDQRLWTALQKIHAGQDIPEAIALVRSQINPPS